MPESILLNAPVRMTRQKFGKISEQRPKIQRNVGAVASGLQQMFSPYGICFPITDIFEFYYLQGGIGSASEQAVKDAAAHKADLEQRLRPAGDLQDPALMRSIANWCLLDFVESHVHSYLSDENLKCDPAIAAMASRAQGFLAGREARLLMAGASLAGSNWVRWFNPRSGALTINDKHPFVLQFIGKMIDWFKVENVSAWGGDYFRNNLPVSGFNVLFALDFLRVQSEEAGIARFLKRADRLLGYGGRPGQVIIVDLAQGYRVSPRLFEWIARQGGNQGFVLKEQESLELVVADEKKIPREIIVLEQA